MYKIIGADGQQYGPVSAEQIRRWIAERRIGAFSRAQGEGAPDWKNLRDFPEFAAVLQPAAPPFYAPPCGVPPINPLIAAKASSKIAAGIFGILLGGLGIHKFVLGYNRAGLIMLLVAVIGSIFTCGFAYCAVHIIGLIEGILYLTKSDEEFVRTYIDTQREWF